MKNWRGVLPLQIWWEEQPLGTVSFFLACSLSAALTPGSPQVSWRSELPPIPEAVVCLGKGSIFQLPALLTQDRLVKETFSDSQRWSKRVRRWVQWPHVEKFWKKKILWRYPKLSGYVMYAKYKIICNITNTPSVFLMMIPILEAVVFWFSLIKHEQFHGKETFHRWRASFFSELVCLPAGPTTHLFNSWTIITFP